MTKQQEIDILSVAIQSLGEDSYLGPWLSQVKAEVESLARNDIFPDITVADAVRHGAAIRGQAISDAAGIIDAADLKAKNIEKAADNHRHDVASRLQDAIRTLERW